MNKTKSTSFSSPICKWTLPLLARKDNEYYPSGTAIIIGQNLAITAKHVIEDFMNRLGTEKQSTTEYKHSFFLQAAQFTEDGNSAVLWNVRRIWRPSHTDIAFLLLEPTVEESLNFEWKNISMDVNPLKVSTEFSAFGYPSPTIEKTDNTINWIHDPITVTGQITQVFTERRDLSFLNFPCYETNALFKPSMSGGPVFTKDGYLCGLICSGFDFGEEDCEPISYIVSLWPSMSTPIDINRIGHPKGITYPILELARDNFISVRGWENIVIEGKSVSIQSDII